MTLTQNQKNTDPGVQEARPAGPRFVWAMMLALFIWEFVFRAVDIIASFFQGKEAQELMASNPEAEQIKQVFGDDIYTAVSVMSAVLMAAFWLVVSGLILIAARKIYKGSPQGNAPRIWVSVLCAYYLYRGVLVFVPADSTAVPNWLYFVWGSIQIISGIGAILVVLSINTKETLSWIGKK
ncbi:MAG: hypothetical protein Q3962_08635 [Corynebacterium sp.]|nr:hypothetical protein [Corynebacterium sp.]